MFYLIVLALRPRIAKPSAAVITLLVCAAIECFKLYHAPWVDAVRATRAGGLLLGHIFLLTNFVSYMLGTAIGLLADARITLPPPKSLPL